MDKPFRVRVRAREYIFPSFFVLFGSPWLLVQAALNCGGSILKRGCAPVLDNSRPSQRRPSSRQLCDEGFESSTK